MKWFYHRSCVEHNDTNVHLLHEMVENAKEISWKTFSRNCIWQPVAKSLHYAIGSSKGLHLKDDWHVSFYKSKYNNKVCYYMKHSAIEYIFIDRITNC